MLIEQPNQKNLEKLIVQNQLNLWIMDPKSRNTASKTSQQRIEQNTIPYYPIFSTPT